MSNRQEIEQLVAALKEAHERGDEPAAEKTRQELDRIAKQDARLAGTITAMLATL